MMCSVHNPIHAFSGELHKTDVGRSKGLKYTLLSAIVNELYRVFRKVLYQLVKLD